ncbi:MAG: transposase, partial [Jatrophihabitans sp.]|uniref:transposase n=1 Tax=Jatrophihabitans sp. TaxID=1932789 RepID=UPI003F7F9F62
AGENSTRLHSEAALARLTGIAPIPASSGATSRYRLHRGGDRQANRAIHMIVLCRLTCHQPTKTYIARRISEGKTKKDAVRCLKRAVVREIYRALISDLHACGIVPAAPTGANQVPPAAEVKAGRRPPEGHGLDHGEDGTTIAAHGAGMTTHHAT